MPLSADVRQYLLITGNYWAFTLSDGALRMLVLLHFHALGYSPLQLALLFVLYELFGVVTNLLGGWLGARIGLNRTMHIGLGLQVVALAMLLAPATWLSVAWVMAAQALSGVAKDLNKMSAKSSIKLLVADDRQGLLFRAVAALTGSKNALKGAGFFLGGVLLDGVGFGAAVGALATALLAVWLDRLVMLRRNIGRARAEQKFRQLLSNSRAVNVLSAARLFLFGARDVWFVVALPVFLHAQLGWDFWRVGGFLAAWTIGYGLVQSVAPFLLAPRGGTPGRLLPAAAALLALVPLAMAGLLAGAPPAQALSVEGVVIGGLVLFGVLFAINSALHSYLIVAHADAQGVSLDVGFYYMANAMGRLLGTVLSGWIYQAAGLLACLLASAAMLAVAALLSLALPPRVGAAAPR